MLPKKYKIGDRVRIEQIMKKGRRISGRLFQWRLLPSRLLFSRFSLILPKKLAPTAVERNKIRRRVFEALRVNCVLPKRGLGFAKQMGPKPSKICYDVVVLLSPRIAKASYADIAADIITIMKKLS